jgi:hypothetical protein
MAGFIKIDRSLLNHWLWDDKPRDRGAAWVDLILLAAWKDHKIGSIKEVKRGQFWTTLRFLARRWGWSKNSVSRFLCRIETDMIVTLKRDTNRRTGGTLITILNYNEYQDLKVIDDVDRDTEGTQTGTQKGHKRDTKGPIRRKVSKVSKVNIPQNSGGAGTDAGNPASYTGATVWAAWHDLHIARHLPAPHPDGRDTRAGKELSKAIPEKDLKATLTAYLDDDIRFLVENGHALRFLHPAKAKAYQTGKEEHDRNYWSGDWKAKKGIKDYQALLAKHPEWKEA